MVLELHIDLAEDLPDREAWPEWCRQLSGLVDAAKGEQIIYDERNRLVRLPGPGGSDTVIKRFKIRRKRDRIIYRFRSGKAYRSYHNAQRLQAAGIATPKPLALVEHKQGSLPLEAMYVCAWQPHTCTLRDYVKLSPADRHSALVGLGQAVAVMHEAGAFHRDLTPGNILLHQVDEGWEYPVVDCNRMRWGRLALWKAVFNLVQLDVADADLETVVAAYAASRQMKADRLMKACRRRQRSYRFKWKIKNATRPWRRKIGM